MMDEIHSPVQNFVNVKIYQAEKLVICSYLLIVSLVQNSLLVFAWKVSLLTSLKGRLSLY